MRQSYCRRDRDLNAYAWSEALTDPNEPFSADASAEQLENAIGYDERSVKYALDAMKLVVVNDEFGRVSHQDRAITVTKWATKQKMF